MQSQLPAMVLSEAEEAGIQQCIILSTLSSGQLIMSSPFFLWVCLHQRSKFFSLSHVHPVGWIALILSSASISIHLWIWPTAIWVTFISSFCTPHLWIGIHLKKKLFFSFICLFIQAGIYISTNACILNYFILWIIMQCCHYFLAQIVSYFGHCELFCVGSLAFPHPPPHPFLTTCLLLWIKRCSRLIQYFSCLSFRICHFFKRNPLWFLSLENGL